MYLKRIEIQGFKSFANKIVGQITDRLRDGLVALD